MSTDAIDFNGGGSFYVELKALVGQYLSDPRRVRRAQVRMYLKSAA